MANIQNLLEKLDTVTKRERDQFSGELPRQFFIELYGAGNVDALLNDYTPTEHNSEWDAERQQPAPEPQKIVQPRQSIAFMSSGKNGIFRRYMENELLASVHGISYINRNRYMLKRTKTLTDKGMKYHE